MPKTYTYNVHCSVVIQYSFTEAEIRLDDNLETEPGEEAMRELERAIEAVVAEKFPVTSLEIFADADDLLDEEEHD